MNTVPNKTFHLAQITDCHLLSDSEGWYKQVQPAKHLQAVIQQLVQDTPDAVLFTGDLTQDHSSGSYQLLLQLCQPLNCPVYCLPGNHDDLSQLDWLMQQPPFFTQRSVQAAGWQLCFLNTKGPTPAGVFPQTEQHWLSQQLSATKAEYTWLFCHHQPLQLGCFIDKYGQQQQTELWQAVAADKRIRGIAHGHSHYAYHRQWQGIDIVGCPASSVQFLPTADWQTEDRGPQWCSWFFSDHGQVYWQFRKS